MDLLSMYLVCSVSVKLGLVKGCLAVMFNYRIINLSIYAVSAYLKDNMLMQAIRVDDGNWVDFK